MRIEASVSRAAQLFPTSCCSSEPCSLLQWRLGDCPGYPRTDCSAPSAQTSCFCGGEGQVGVLLVLSFAQNAARREQKPQQNTYSFLRTSECNENVCVLPPRPPAKLITSGGMKKNSQNVRLSHTAPLGGYIYFRVGALIKTIYPWLSLSAFPSLCLHSSLFPNTCI